jgi:2-[(L-alanin-3-ylcarbamoyl)methyl]-3-(2-aminoethylcarbamoyl)-2-hydroxypropanoate synthase
VLGEVHGVSVVPGPPTDLIRSDTEGVLAAIWRTSLAPRLDAGERAVPVTGLTAAETDGTPLIAPWLAEHGARAWVEALVDAVALPLVHLLVAHGVALESHAQNMSLVLRDGLPMRVALKDFHDGVRFCRRLLADPDDAPALAPPPPHHTNRNSFVETDEPTQVSDFLLDALFFVNLGELGLFLAEHDLMDESEFWTIVAGRVRAHDRRHGSGTFDLFAPTLEVEKLTTRRLTPDTELALHRVSNPLHRFGGR